MNLRAALRKRIHEDAYIRDYRLFLSTFNSR